MTQTYPTNRYYAPNAGRFITEDPIRDGMNWYVYCGNNPIMHIDPLGLWEDGDEKYPEFVQKAIRIYTDDWIAANSIGDEKGKITAHGKAESARALGDVFVRREEWGAKDFDDWVDDAVKKEIVIHHTDSNDSVKTIEKKHIKRNFSGIGYHFIIDKNGDVYEGRPLDKKGEHVANANTGKIGVSLIGDYQPGWFDNNKPTQEQLLSMIRLVQVLSDIYGITIINGHRDYNDVMGHETLCPGDTLYESIERIY